jgi:hypothetical protein
MSPTCTAGSSPGKGEPAAVSLGPVVGKRRSTFFLFGRIWSPRSHDSEAMFPAKSVIMPSFLKPSQAVLARFLKCALDAGCAALQSTVQRLSQHGFSVADLELARRFDVQRLHDAVNHQHGIALRPQAHAPTVQVQGKPVALVKTALPSAIMRTLPCACCSRPQAPMTKASFTEMHQISSTPAALSLSACAM